MLQFENDSGITSSTKSSSSTCTITYRPATVQDVPEAAALITLGRADNPLEWACYPDLYSSTGEPLYTTTPSPKEELEKLTLSRRKMFHDALDNPETHRLWVAVASSTTTSSSDGAATGISNTMENDTSSVGVLLQKPVETKTNGNTSRIVGFIIWQLCPQGNSIEKWQEIFDYRYNLPPFDDFMKIINPVSKEIIGIDVPYLYLDQLYVHPEYTRRGIATTLGRLAMKEADMLDLPIFIEASPMGAITYSSKNWVFTTKKTLYLELQVYGIDSAVELYQNSLMWRERKSIRDANSVENL